MTVPDEVESILIKKKKAGEDISVVESVFKESKPALKPDDYSAVMKLSNRASDLAEMAR